MTRRATMLLAVAIAGPASADPQPAPEKPRTLATGAPACGNVMLKGQACVPAPQLRAILTSITRQVEEILEMLPAVGGTPEPSLTLALGGRPRL